MGRIQRWLMTLREEQQKSNCHVPMAAIVIRNNKIVAKSSNIKGYRGSSLHAETAALRKLRYQKKGTEGASVFIGRFRHDGSMGNAKPCANCIEVLKLQGINDCIISVTSVLRVTNCIVVKGCGFFFQVS